MRQVRIERAQNHPFMSADPYTLRRGQAGAERLRILGDAMAASTRRFLRESGLAAGMRCLDAGCGVGVVSRNLYELTGHCHGIDLDPQFVEMARRTHSEVGFTFETANLLEIQADPTYDVIYSRYLLSHLKEPESAVLKLVDLLKPGGLLLLEDVDFPGHVHHPPNSAFQRYLELYQEVVKLNGGDPCLGRKLYSLVLGCGLESVEMELIVSLQHRDPGKRVAELTLEHVTDSLTERGIIGADDLSRTLKELRDYRRDEGSFMSIAPTYQVRAKKPATPNRR